MEMNFNATVELKPDDLRRLVENAMRAASPSYTVGSVKFDVGLEWEGGSIMGWQVAIFRGAKVELVPINPAES